MINNLGIFTLTSHSKQPSSQLTGYLFVNDSLVLGTQGLLAYQKAHGPIGIQRLSGRFGLIESTHSKTTHSKTIVQSDSIGQELLFYGQFGDFWVVSNSLLAATEAMRAHQVPVIPHQTAIDSYKIGTGSLNGGQPVSLQTPVTGLQLAPAGFAFEIHYPASQSADSLATLTLRPQPERETYSSYQDYIQSVTGRAISRASALVKLAPKSTMSLSGGIDSRICLALLSHSGTAPSSLHCYSHPHMENELAIAKQLGSLVDAKVAGERLSNPNSITKLTGLARYKLALYGNAGVCANFNFRYAIPHTSTVSFTGGSVIGNVSMSQGVDMRRAQYVHELGERTGSALADEFANSMRPLNIGPDDPRLAYYHYAQIRARTHYGLNWFRKLGSLQVHPLMDADLIDAHHYVPLSYIAQNGVNRDMILLAQKKLLEVPYESPRKIKTTENLAVEAPLDVIDYQVFGSFEALFTPTEEIDAFNQIFASKQNFRVLLADSQAKLGAVAARFGFSAKFARIADQEITERSRFRRAGVLLGLLELFGTP